MIRNSLSPPTSISDAGVVSLARGPEGRAGVHKLGSRAFPEAGMLARNRQTKRRAQIEKFGTTTLQVLTFLIQHYPHHVYQHFLGSNLGGYS